MSTTGRRIGTIGTASRVLVGLGLLYLALFEGLSWELAWREAVLGLIVFPLVMVAVGLAARRFGSGSLRLTGPLGLALNTAVIVALFLSEHTADAAAFFYGATMLVAAWRDQPGCEATVLSNWILGRDDQVGCPVLTPIDATEARLSRRHGRHRTQERSGEV